MQCKNKLHPREYFATHTVSHQFSLYTLVIMVYLLGTDAWRPSVSGSPLRACSSRCLGGTGPGSAAASGGGPGPRSRLLARCTPRTGWWGSKRTPRHNWTVSRMAAGKQMRHRQHKRRTYSIYNCAWHVAYSSGSQRRCLGKQAEDYTSFTIIQFTIRLIRVYTQLGFLCLSSQS